MYCRVRKARTRRAPGPAPRFTLKGSGEVIAVPMSSSPVEAYVSLGSNLGDREGWLRAAASSLARLPATRLTRISSLYETRPWGLTDQPDFLNAAACLLTSLEPLQLLRQAQAVEAQLGRLRTVRWGPRTVDIDLLVYDDLRMATPELTLPHPRMLERAFVLVPLAEIAPELRVDGRTVREHLARLGDVAADVRRVGTFPMPPLEQPPG